MYVNQQVERRMPKQPMLRFRSAPRSMTLLMVYIPERHSMNRPTIDQKVVNELQFHRRDAVAVAALSYVRKRIKSVVKG